jgi:3-hydroxyisobutyrate dehydrogenase-like beta-hydroxyacid dehydrogenase
MVLGIMAGLEPQIIYDMVTSGAGNSRIFELRAPMMVRNRYDEPTMKVATWQKDMQVIGEFAGALGCPTPLFTATRPIYAAALAGGHAADDTASVCTVLEAKAGVKRGKAVKKARKG